VDISARVTEVLAPSPQVVRVDLVGSRARGEETALSDWDFRIDTTNGAVLARELPTLVQPLEPLAAQWDRLTERATYMLMMPGAVKVDLFPGDELRAIQPPWEPTPSNLVAIDAHFWDWALWLGGKVLAEKAGVVSEELGKLHRNLLGPLGVTSPPATVEQAVAEYRGARDRLERRWEMSVPRRMADEVALALVRHGVI
jgi:predicted nucleotidyltransferase